MQQGRALGNPTDITVVGKCEACHTLKTTEGEPNTAYINNAARIIGTYKIALGRSINTTDVFPCTFCHSNLLDNTTMDDVLTDFEYTGIQHPTGMTVAGANNNNEYLSNAASTPSGSNGTQLQCIDCHQTALVGYPYHEGRTTDPGIWAGSWDKTINTSGLQGVTVAASQAEKEHCLTCHGDLGASNGATKPKMAHLARANYSSATNTMYDSSGNALNSAATATCTVCHDTHTSTKAGMIQDGIDRGAADPGRTAITDSSCTTVCHSSGAFNTHGHGGKVGINNVTCTPCHSASIRHSDTTDAASKRRLGMVYEGTAMSNLTMNLSADGLDNDMDGVKDNETAFAYSKTSVCKTCHQNYAGHGGGARNAACVDCHDMHGDAAVANNNVAMIRSSIFGENTVFTAADRTADTYYKGTGNATGVCDNDACHANIAGGLETAHKGGTGAVLSQPCSDCHTISHVASPNTENSFKTSCSSCHGNAATDQIWPNTVVAVPAPITAYPDRDGNHAKHVNVIMTKMNAMDSWATNGATDRTLTTMSQDDQLEICGYCHTDSTPNFGHATHYNSSWNMADAIKVLATVQPADVGSFNPIWNKAATDANGAMVATLYAANNVTAATSGCNLIDCHNGVNTTSTAPNDYRWYGANTTGCVMCHTDVTAQTAHTVHTNGSATYGYNAQCIDCHGENIAWGSPGTAPAANHYNGSFTAVGYLRGNAAYTITYAGFTYPGTKGTCGTNACHSNGALAAPYVTTYTWGTAQASACEICHRDTTAMATNAHNEHMTAPTAVPACSVCHVAQTATTHLDGSVNIDAVQATYSLGSAVPVSTAPSGNCTTASCHNRPLGFADASVAWNVPTGTGTPGTNDLNCNDCHYWEAAPSGANNTARGTMALTASHNEHFDKSKTCTQCHGALPTTTAHINASATIVDACTAAQNDATVSWGDASAVTDYTLGADNSCYTPTNNGLGCHATAGLTGAADPSRPVWGTAFSDCTTYCHTNTTTAAVNPTSGLHNMTATNVQKHDGTLAGGGCTACHANLTADPATHMNGTLPVDAASNTDRFITRASMTYTDNGVNTATCMAASPATGLDGCHSDGGEWGRLWSTEANLDYTTGANRDAGNAVCNVCHGQYPTLNARGWRPGTSHYESSDLGDKTQEDKGKLHTDTPGSVACEDCHAYYGTAGNHENGSITFSDGAPSGYTLALNGTAYYCQSCHTAKSGESVTTTSSHTFKQSTAFPTAINHVDGVSEPTGCSGCHGNATNDTIWPDNATSTNITYYPDRDGNHLKHVTVIMNRLNAVNGWAVTPATDRTMAAAGMTQADAVEICGFCHTDGSPNFGHATHYNSSWDGTDAMKLGAVPADVGSINPLWNKAGTDSDAAMVATTYTGSAVTAGTSGCNLVDCHNAKNTTSTAPNDYRWYGANTSNCIMCHTAGGTTDNNPHSGLHTGTPTITGAAHDDSFAASGTCTTCHDSAVVPTSLSHINGSSTANDTATGTAEYYTVAMYTDAAENSGTCSGAGAPPAGVNTGCHDLGDAGSWARKWSTTAYDTIASGNPCANCHGGGGVAWTFGSDNVVNDNLVSHDKDWNNDGTANEVESNHNTCKTCHGSNGPSDSHANYTTSTNFWNPRDGAGRHGDGSITMNGPTPATGAGYATGVYGCNNVSACHGNDWSGVYPAGSGHRLEKSNWSLNYGDFGAAACDGCHGYPPTTTGHVAGLTAVNHAILNDNSAADVVTPHNECGYCHGVKDDGTMGGFSVQDIAALGGTYTYVTGTDHKDGSITMNSGATMTYATGTCTNGKCHLGNAAHTMKSGSAARRTRDFGPGKCQTCHQSGGGVSAPIVAYNTAGNHVNPAANTAPATEQCTACHAGHADGTSGANDVEIQTRYGGSTAVPTMNNQYSSHSYRIQFGGTATTGYPDTEAQKCWGCHYDQAAALGTTMSEFGINNNTNTGSMNYNYGTLSTYGATHKGGWYQSNGTTVATWYTAQRSAPTFAYKDGALQSMHGANYNAAGPGNDPVGEIRCAYCHDVHNTSDAPTGSPYLRGTWKGNPFKEDGAPQSTSNYTNYASLGAFPRISKASTMLGGYNINENFSGGTTDANTAGLGADTNINNWAGLCEHCHGANKNGTWTATAIDTLDWGLYTTGTNNNDAATKWAGSYLSANANASGNGHANSVLGGSGTSASQTSDIYNERIRNSRSALVVGTADGYYAGRPAMVFQQVRGGNGYGFRGGSAAGYSAGNTWSFNPVQAQVTGATSRPSYHKFYNWGSGTYTTAAPAPANMVSVFAPIDKEQNKYHQFPCAKCHIPHASRLPRLMITNCLDVKHSTWGNGTPYATLPAASPYTVRNGEALDSVNFSKKWPETTAANNCHRVKSGAAGMTGQGWNTVTPW